MFPRTLRATVALTPLMLSGCLVVPLPGPPPEAAFGVRAKVGDAASSKPVRPGATREEVIASIGQPFLVDVSREWACHLMRDPSGHAYTFFLIAPDGPVSSDAAWRSPERFVLINYDPAGIARSVQVIPDNDQLDQVRKRLAEQGIEMHAGPGQFGAGVASTRPG